MPRSWRCWRGRPDVLSPLRGRDDDYDDLLERIGDRRLVLIGEASHGTHEFYAERARITKRLILEKGFGAVAVEADWPDAYRVNRYVRLESRDASADEALSGFERFPTWMWRNRDVVAFVDWLREINAGRAAEARVGFYGLDLYSLYTSIAAVVAYLDRVDPEAARRARDRYACFDHFDRDSRSYGLAAHAGAIDPCEAQVVAQLRDLRERASEYVGRDGFGAGDEYFYAEQNARLAANAEEYYRTMYSGRVSSWNLRDAHMADTLDALLAHLRRPDRLAKIVVWEHNSHVGDATATQMGRQGEFNVGQLARERHGSDTFLIGFSGYAGTVTAASNWDEPAQRMTVRPALPESYEALFHRMNEPRFVLTIDEDAERMLRGERLVRAIGVIYRPETERWSHYFHSAIAKQFDAIVHIDETTALEPLEPGPGWTSAEPAETYPFAV